MTRCVWSMKAHDRALRLPDHSWLCPWQRFVKSKPPFTACSRGHRRWPTNRLTRYSNESSWATGGDHADLVHRLLTRPMARNQICVPWPRTTILNHSEKVQLWPADTETICLLEEWNIQFLKTERTEERRGMCRPENAGVKYATSLIPTK